jgi:hypothetical protein
MKLKVKRNDALAHFYLADDSGAWFAVCCAKGAMKLLGRTLEKNEEVIVDLEVKPIG